METLVGLKNAWLSPRGEIITDHPGFYPGHAWHEGLAACIVMDLQGLRTPYEATEFATKGTPHTYIYEYLESIGWIRLCGWGESTRKWIVSGRMTPAQRRVIKNWCLENDVAWDQAVDTCDSQIKAR